MTYVITNPCHTCLDAACLTVCPCDCIHLGMEHYYIDPDECVDCGACTPVCPVEAIFDEHDLSGEVLEISNRHVEASETMRKLQKTAES